MLNFKQYLLEYSFNELNNWLQQNNTTIQQVIQQAQQRPPDAKGGNADFWAIPNSSFGIRIVRNNQSTNQTNSTLTAANDPHPEMNFGQPIANFGNVQILKLQSGSPAGMKMGAHKLPQDAQNQEILKFKQRIEEAANLPQTAYDQLMQQLQYLNNKGYRIDPSKPGNLLIDPTKGFNLVDISQSKQGSSNTPSEIIVMLMDNFNFNKYKLSEDPQYKKLAQTIIQKVQKAAANVGLEFGTSGSAEYSMSLAGMA